MSSVIGMVKKNKFVYKIALRLYSKHLEMYKTNIAYCKLCNLVMCKRIIKTKNISVFRYCKENNIPIAIIEEEQIREIYRPHIMYPSGDELKEEVFWTKTPSIYRTTLKNAVITGEANYIIVDDLCLDDKFDLAYREELVFESTSRIKCNKKESLVIVDKKNEAYPEGIFFLGEAANNYYHWTFDILSKIFLINKFDELEGIPLFVDETILLHNTYKYMLQILDTEKHPLIPVSRNKSYRVEILHYISPCTWSSVYAKSKSTPRCMKSKCIINDFRDSLLPKTDKKCIDYEKIFIIRSDDTDKTRRLVNESSLAQIASKYGFVTYDPGKHSLEEQISVFNHARFIIGDEGAAMVNSMYAGEDTIVYCIVPVEWRDYVFSTIAYLAGTAMIYLDAEDLHYARKHRLDEAMFEKLLKTLN